MDGYASVRYQGEWIQSDDNTMKYVGGSKQLIKIPYGTTFEGFIQLLMETCGLDPMKNYLQLSMKPRKIELDCPVQIQNDEDVQGLIDMSQYLQECIPVFVTCTLIERQEEEEEEDDDEEISRVKKEYDLENLIDFNNDPLYIANSWAYGEKDMVPDWGDFDGNDMSDIPSEELELEYMSSVTEGINSSQFEDPISSGENYFGSFFDNVPTDPFRWLPDFSPQPSISSGGTKLIREENGIKLGDIFHNKVQLKDAVKKFVLLKGFQFMVKKSDRGRWDIKCNAENCQWYIHARKSKVGEVFQINQMNPTHTCSVNQIIPHHRQAEAQALGQLMRSKFVLIDRIYRPKEIIVDIADRYKIDISYSQAWRVRNWALNSLRGSPEESFMLLPDYCYNLQRTNPGTVTAIETDDDHRFKYFFMALGCSVRAFREYLRPVICIDAAFLKGQYLGHLFFAVGFDGNNQIYPIGFGVGKKEDHDTWCWFLKKIKECIYDLSELAIISDRHHAIYSAMAEVFPDVHHGCCCHHLLCNIWAKYKRDSKVTGAYWKAVKSYTKVEFEATMQSLDSMNLQVGAYLREIGFECWSKAYFPGQRYNIMTTNIAESFNAFVRHARGLPITILVEFIRSTMQRWFYERRNHANKCSNFVTPWTEEKISRRLSKSARLKVQPITPTRYQVVSFGGYMSIVDFGEMSCTCRKFQLSHIPCKHAIAVAQHMRLTNVNAWVHPFFRTDLYRAIYQDLVNPLGNQSEWLHSPEERVVLPPVIDNHRPGHISNKNRRPS